MINFTTNKKDQAKSCWCNKTSELSKGCRYGPRKEIWAD